MSSSKTVAVPRRDLFPAWCEFVDRFPFARTIAPTQLGLCGNNPASIRPLGPAYLPAEPIDAVKSDGRQQTAWYDVDSAAVSTFLDTVARYEIDLENIARIESEAEVILLAENMLKQGTPKWFLGFRDITNATNERTVIASILPRVGVGNKIPLIIPDGHVPPVRLACLYANLVSLVFDFVARQKIGGTTLNYFLAKQLPVLPPEIYTADDLNFIIPRVLELAYTAHDLRPWALDLGFDGPPFAFNSDRRLILRAELDAWYGKLYGITREVLCYILDPASVMGADYPSETFRVLKNSEEREFGEFRTQRLVLAAWDALEHGELH